LAERRRRRLALNDLSPLIVLVLALAITLGTGLFFWYYSRNRDELRFENAVQSAADNIVSRLDVYRAAVRGAAALFAAREDVAEDAFRRYIDRLDIHNRYPGIQGIGWSERVVYLPGDSVDERHRIRYLEPRDARNTAAIGFDMYAERTRRAAMALARDSGRQVMSGKVVLVQEIIGPKQAGFLIYSPVYRGGIIPRTVQERRERLIGFTYSPFRADDLFRGIFGTERQPRVSFSVYDGAGTDTANLLHASPRAREHQPSFNTTKTLSIAARTWTVVYSSEPAFEQTSASLLWLMVFMAAGTLASFWLFLFSHGQARARAEAEAASSAKSNFLAVMSHELRTPLNAIGGYVDLMELNIAGPVTEQQRGYLQRIRRAQQHLLGLINSVLNYSKLQSSAVTYHMARHNVGSLVADIEGLMLPQMQMAGLQYVNEGGPVTEVNADREKTIQILLNLLSNAVKFTNEGGSVKIGWSADGNAVFLRVTDTGVGISEDQLERIFDPFVQVDADLTRTRQGTGLGLAIARELARGMNGDLTVDTEPGRGSTFTLVLRR
jgi:signal transduction histidine kinase